ncbi:MAG: hypothetical protein QF752_17485 [Planctomycetota bacterium]|jgi:hypothetical protein|nr:hypothetical protein [Planctomycetota bacterium]
MIPNHVFPLVGPFFLGILLLASPAFSDENSSECIQKLMRVRQAVMNEFCRQPDVEIRQQLFSKLKEIGRRLDLAIQAQQQKTDSAKHPSVSNSEEAGSSETYEGTDNQDKPDPKEVLKKVRKKIIEYFRDDFMPSDEFRSAFGPQKWSQIGAEVEADARKFGAGEDSEVYEEDNSLTYTGRIWDLYTEVTVSRSGEVQNIYFEID